MDLAAQAIGATYDPGGHVLTQSETTNGQTVSTESGLVTGYYYDAVGRLRLLTLPGIADLLHITVDAAGRITALGENGATASYGYSADGQPTQASLPGGITESTQYDAAGRLTQRTITGHGLDSTYSYTYNPAGWMTSIVSTVNGTGPLTTTLTHDAFGHLTGASTSGGGAAPGPTPIATTCSPRTAAPGHRPCTTSPPTASWTRPPPTVAAAAPPTPPTSPAATG